MWKIYKLFLPIMFVLGIIMGILWMFVGLKEIFIGEGDSLSYAAASIGFLMSFGFLAGLYAFKKGEYTPTPGQLSADRKLATEYPIRKRVLFVFMLLFVIIMAISFISFYSLHRPFSPSHPLYFSHSWPVFYSFSLVPILILYWWYMFRWSKK